MTPEQAAKLVQIELSRIVEQFGEEAARRGYRASNAMHTQLNQVLRGQRSGRRYKVPLTYGKRGKGRKRGRYYTASAPGEAPANRTGIFRLSWNAKPRVDRATASMTIHVSVENGQKTRRGQLLGQLLEEGTAHMAPRPYQEEVKARSLPKVEQIYREPYMR